MLGAIIGDIIGSRYEFDATNDYNFEMFAEGSNFTDDTVCTIAIADALLTGNDYGISLHEWCRKYPNPKGGYGGRFRQWVESVNPKPYGSFGNGSAMRVSPVGWWFFKPEEVLKEAAKTSECTHNHPEGVKGACTVALAIALALRMKRSTGEVDVKALLEECVRFSGYDIDINRKEVLNRFDETCQGTVPVALWIISKSNSFEDAIRRAVSLGADADTLGAIVGSIAEIIWGIPEWMKQKALSYLPSEMKNVLRDFRKEIVRRRNKHEHKIMGKVYTPENITKLGPDDIFVFGSNLEGQHMSGAARVAYDKFGAKWGQGVGLQGQSYAIPTMQGGVDTIKPYVDQFIELAREWDQNTFYVTRIGCGIAGFRDEEIAPLFDEAYDLYNVRLPKSFSDIIERRRCSHPNS